MPKVKVLRQKAFHRVSHERDRDDSGLRMAKGEIERDLVRAVRLQPRAIGQNLLDFGAAVDIINQTGVAVKATTKLSLKNLMVERRTATLPHVYVKDNAA